jgi:hypothetical protein
MSGPFERRFQIDKLPSPVKSNEKPPLPAKSSPKQSTEGTATPAQGAPTPPANVITSPGPEDATDLFGDSISLAHASISPPRY